MAFSPDGRHVVSGGDDRKAAIWDLSQGTCKLSTLEGHAEAVLTCAWSPKGDTIATGSEDWTARLWDAHTFRQRASIQLKGPVVCLVFSSNGSRLACGSRRGECCIVNVPSGALHRSLWNPLPNDIDSILIRSGPHSKRTPRQARSGTDTIAAFDPTSGSTRLATAPCGTCAGINVVDTEAGTILAHPGGKRGEFMRMRDVSFSPDGTLVLGVTQMSGKLEGAFVWRAATGIEVFRLMEHTDSVRKARFSPCGRYIASAGTDQTVRLWRTSDGECVATLSEHKEPVEHVAFSPDGDTLSSGGISGTVVIRQMRDIISMNQQDFRPLVDASHQTSVAGPITNTFLSS